VFAALKDAHAAVLPSDAGYLHDRGAIAAAEFARILVERAKAARKPVIAIYAGDSRRDLPIKLDVLLRHSIDGCKRRRGDYCFPGWFEAVQNEEAGQRIELRSLIRRPVVSFCGQAAQTGRHFVRRISQVLLNLKYGSHTRHADVDAHLLRRRAMNAFESSSEVNTSFISRDTFYVLSPTKRSPNKSTSTTCANLITYFVCEVPETTHFASTMHYRWDVCLSLLIRTAYCRSFRG